MNRIFLSRLSGWSAGLLLLATAGFHATGVGLAKAGAEEVSEPFFAAVLVPIWLFASFHWLAFALLAGLLAGVKEPRARLTLAILGAALLVDAALMANAVGPFIGTVFIAASGSLLLLSAILARRAKPAL